MAHVEVTAFPYAFGVQSSVFESRTLLQSLGEAKLCVHVFVCRQSSGAGPRTQWHSHARRAGRAGRAHTPGGAVQVSAINLSSPIQMLPNQLVSGHTRFNALNWFKVVCPINGPKVA